MPLVLDGDTGIVGVLLTDANGNVTFDTNTLYVDAPNNRVGIGTTSPLSGFHISDGTNAGSPQNASRKATLMIDAGATASADLQFMVRNGYNSHIFFGDAADPNVGMLWYDHSTNHMNFSANTNHVMTIDDNGNVGIGSTNPSTKLHVDGGGSAAELRVAQNSTYYTDIGINHIDVYNNDLRILMGGSEKWRFKSGGDLYTAGVQEIKSGDKSAHGYEAFFGANSLRFNRDGDSYIDTRGTNNNLKFRHNSNYDTAMTILGSNGNVGIGTTGPNYPLEVEATATTNTDIVGFSNSNGTAKHIFGLENVGAGTYRLLDSSNNNAVFFSGHSADKSYLNVGDFGIGTSNPVAPLVVSNGGAEGWEIDPALVGSNHNRITNFNRSTSTYCSLTTDAASFIHRINGSDNEKLEFVSNGLNLKSATYAILNVQTDIDDNSTSNDGIIKISNGSSGTTKAEFRWDESEDTVQIAYGDHGRHILIKSDGKVGINTPPLADTTGTLHVGGGLSVGAGNHAGYHVFSQHEGNVPANTTRDVLQFEGPAYARYMTVTISGYLCRKEQYFSGYQSWDGASNGNSVGSTVNGTTTFNNGTNSSDSRAKIQLECSAVSGTSGHPRYKLKLITGGVTGQLYDTTIVVKFYNPPFYPTYL